jgi:hypothetical protein
MKDLETIIGKVQILSLNKKKKKVKSKFNLKRILKNRRELDLELMGMDRLTIKKRKRVLRFGKRRKLSFGKRRKLRLKKNKGLTKDMYTIKTSTIPNAGRGAFANIRLPKRTVLGNYKGKRLTPQQYNRLRDQSYVWETSSRKGSVYIDGKNPKTSNWLRFLNDSRDKRVNVEPYQYRGKLYYRTIRVIKPGEELFISYGDEYW